MSATVPHRYVHTTCAAAVLFAAVASAQTVVTPSNTTVQLVTGRSFELFVVGGAAHGALVPASHLVPLTARAADNLDAAGLTGQLFHATNASATYLNHSNVAYINCDSSVYRDKPHASDVLDIAVKRGAIAVLFFSTSARYCNLAGDIVDTLPFLYSMVNATTSQRILQEVEAISSSGDRVYFVRIALSTANEPSSGANDAMSSTSADTGASEDQSNDSSLGPSPSTAVAMIILYSITGIITALFVAIIITGALRAHRHPERYGPGVVLDNRRGGTRQTRVRGIARAMLDTLPVVKFGDGTSPQRPPKPADVEMADMSTPCGTEQVQQPSDAHTRGLQSDRCASTNSLEIAPPPAAVGCRIAADLPEDTHADCTICTDEFEPGQDVRVLPCNHRFHPGCIDPWLLNVSGTCPLCRIDLNPTTPSSEEHHHHHHHHTHDQGSSNSTRYSASILLPPLPSQVVTDAPNLSPHSRRDVIRDLLQNRSNGTPRSEQHMAGSQNPPQRDPDTTDDGRRRSRRLSTLFMRDRSTATTTHVEAPLPAHVSER